MCHAVESLHHRSMCLSSAVKTNAFVNGCDTSFLEPCGLKVPHCRCCACRVSCVLQLQGDGPGPASPVCSTVTDKVVGCSLTSTAPHCCCVQHVACVFMKRRCHSIEAATHFSRHDTANATPLRRRPSLVGGGGRNDKQLCRPQLQHTFPRHARTMKSAHQALLCQLVVKIVVVKNVCKPSYKRGSQAAPPHAKLHTHTVSQSVSHAAGRL